MTILLYDLAGIDGRRPSPFCWRTKFALAHKGLEFEARPVSFGEIRSLYGGAYKTVPIIDDGGQHINDSWAIADYLDSAYPDRPKLFATDAERAHCRLIEMLLFVAVAPHLFPMYVKDIHDQALEEDRAYFRESREKGLGKTIEEACADRESRLDEARNGFLALRLTLDQGQPFLSGERPGYTDYMAAGLLLWIATVGTLPLLRGDDSLLPWLDRVRDLYGGLGRAGTFNAISA